MPQVRRVLPPMHQAYGLAGPHMIGETPVEFDADGLAEVDDPALLEAMTQWPEAFRLDPPPAPEHQSRQTGVEGVETTPAAPDFNVEALESLTVSELRDLASMRGVTNIHQRNKRDLIEAILARQQPAEP